MTSSWFFLPTLNYDARSVTHQIYKIQSFPNAQWITWLRLPYLLKSIFSRPRKAGTPETSVPVYENQWTSAYSSCQYRFKRYSKTYRLHSTFLAGLGTYRISRKFQRSWSDSKTFSPRTHVTWCNLLWFKLFSTPYIKPIRRPRLRYSGRHLSNVSLSCTWNEEEGKFMLPHQSRHCRKCIRSPARSPGGHTADSEQDGISKKNRKRKGDSELCVTVNTLS